jgi:hypothetical protein
MHLVSRRAGGRSQGLDAAVLAAVILMVHGSQLLQAQVCLLYCCNHTGQQQCGC